MSIRVSELSKTYQFKKVEKGFASRIKSIVSPAYETYHAVSNVSFQVEQAEMVAFIGPNGAGKSTTIKMLSGLLFPSAGTVTVLGLNPWKDRKKLNYSIGSVYGQKSQLWFHLPPIDTFKLVAKIYEISTDAYKKQLAVLTELFQLEPIMNVPVRKLSLGQRMKCEIVTSLLHNPKVLFLDEPTIGLDLIAKQQIREALKEMNGRGTTVFLTSHDLADIEALCERVIMINNGTKILDESMNALKRHYQHERVLTIKFTKPVEWTDCLEGVTASKENPFVVNFRINTALTSVASVVSVAMDRYPVLDFAVNEPPLEEIISKYYKVEH